MAQIIYPPSKSIFQKLYDKIKYAKTPKWLTELTNLLMPVLQQTISTLGQDAIEILKTLVVEASLKDLSGAEKKAWVIRAFKDSYKNAKDSVLNAVIENLVLTFKVKGKF